MQPVRASVFETAQSIARRFVEARREATALREYPGPIPPNLESAYACQEAAIDLWPDEIAGWKIGRIPPAFESKLGDTRLAGPIFRRAVHRYLGREPVPFGVFPGGFAAVEAEIIFEIGEDAPPAKTSWSDEDAARLVGRVFAGVEIAGSPFAGINALGPTVTISDFGNNSGLILGHEVKGWREKPLDSLSAETFIDGKSVGTGSPANILGGPLGSLSFVTALCAGRKRPLKAGMLITTGALTGIHEISAGESARIEFTGLCVLECVGREAAKI